MLLQSPDAISFLKNGKREAYGSNKVKCFCEVKKEKDGKIISLLC
jgi:hypothetical protein